MNSLRRWRVVKLLLDRAQTSDVSQKHAAAIIKGHEIISVGVNRYSKEIHASEDNIICNTIHAEMDAIRRLPRPTRGADLIVIRVGPENALKNSRPCAQCLAKLSKVGINRIIYSNESGGITCEYVSSAPRTNI